MHPLRTVRVGDVVASSLLGRRRARRLDAQAILLPGASGADAYRAGMDVKRDDFAAWDGRFVTHEPDGEVAHRLLVLDRYGQVYAVHDAAEAAELPDAGALEEWFRFLATACPECGVLDDPLLTGPTP